MTIAAPVEYRSHVERSRFPKPVSVTLFSGVGGSSKALRDLGHFVVAHDFNAAAIDSLRANGFAANHESVLDIDWTQRRAAYDALGGVKVLEGGPPCQPFSQSHDGDGQYDPRDMIPEFLRAIDGLHPELFVMEEVQTLTWAKHRDYFDMVLDHMRTLGYQVDWQVLDASDYNIPQKRKRLIVVGRRLDIVAAKNDLATYGDIQWPIKSDVKKTMAEALDWTPLDCDARNKQVPDARAHDETGLFLWPMIRPGVTVVGSFRPEVQAAPGYRVKGDPPRQGTPGSVVCTLEERLILQDFPADWIVCGKPAERDLQVGNSVPVGMMRAVIEVNL